METKELSVWEWIALQCHKLGWYSSANVAEFLAGVEKEMWKKHYRNAWKHKQHLYEMMLDNSDYQANFLVAVARYRHIRWGCFVSGYDCENCALAKKQGVCNQSGTIMHFWQYVLLQDSQEQIDEKLQKDIKENLIGVWYR